MKNCKIMLVLATVTLAVVSCGPKKAEKETVKEEAPKTIVLFYSQTSNTRAVAQEIATKLGADMEEILAVNPYDGDFKATIERSIQEREQGITPEIQPLTSDLSKYDVVFLGYPIWFGTYAPPVATFLNQVDLSDKKIVPFCTFGSGGLESSVTDLAEAEPQASVLPGYGVRAARLDAMPEEVDQFLKANGFIEGEYIRLADFPEQHPVNDEEASIFNFAVEGYPMLNARAKTVATRAIPNGIEHLFVAEDMPREDQPDMPPTGEIKVYVSVIGEQDPVFTRVVR